MESRNLSHSRFEASARRSRERDTQGEHGDGTRQIEEFPINKLAQLCSEETNKFLRQGVSDDRYCFELFRRAIIRRDDAAWASLYQQYSPLVLTWVNQHQSAAAFLLQDGPAPLVNATFAKFSQALTPSKMDKFDTLAGILKYLKMCAHSVVADEVRSRQSRQYEEALELMEHEPASEDPTESVIAELSAQTLWQVLQEELHGDDEKLLIYLAYVYGMKPGEICDSQRKFFPTVEDVYRIKRNVLERLRRNRRLQALFQNKSI
ncbi:MAG TPA: hypothetical protein VFN23_08585 [Ktedonobacteraceae bacterium]|nr:hypothetical protein [Ktedonobacteraceae bacterium]